jgi:hypothetical protein
MDKEEYNRISSLETNYLKAKELQKLTTEQRKAYTRIGNAIRNKAYRDNNKDDVNQRRKEQRNGTKAVANIPIPTPEITVLKPIKKRVKPLNKNTDITEGTLKNYISIVRTIYKDHYNKDIDDNDDLLKLLRNEKSNYKKIKETYAFISNDVKAFATKYFKRMSVVYGVFSRVYGMTKLLNQLHPYLQQSTKNYDENRSKIANVDDVNISFDKKDVINNLNKLDERTDMLIYSLLFLIPTRRIGEYINTKNAKTEADINDLKYNWYYNGKIYINNSKNKTKIILDIPEVIDINIDKNDEYLLGKLYTSNTITSKLGSITKKIYDKQYTSNQIRHMYATYINNKGSSLAEREASVAGTHSVIQQLKYVYRGGV